MPRYSLSEIESKAKEFGGARTAEAYEDRSRSPNPDVYSYHFPTYEASGAFADAMRGSEWVVIGGHHELFPLVCAAITWPRNSRSSQYKRRMLAKFGEGSGGDTGPSSSLHR